MSAGSQEKMQHGSKMQYGRFAAMIATSTVVMFGLMYLNTYAIEHLRWSETRVYMAILMGAVMAVIMLGYMWSMYEDVRLNIAILAGAIIVFAAALFLVRSQATVNDVSYMRAMIPHHSIAIMTSQRANIDDQRVRELADEIIEAQRREIAEMDWLIADIAMNGLATTQAQAAERPVPEFTAGS
jgi:type IV secretory pathway VirB2 component (pilin)